VANTLDYYDMATITAVKSFIVQAPGRKCLPRTNTLAYLLTLATSFNIIKNYINEKYVRIRVKTLQSDLMLTPFRSISIITLY
jgi:hypothetical protein